MSKKQVDKENEELEKLRKDIAELRKDADKNYHWVLLKQWLIMVALLGLVPLFALIVAIVSHFITLPMILPEPIEPSKLEEISPVIFNAIVTINGLIIGFVPLITFFFIREVRERERGFEQDWKEEQKKTKDEELKLINTYYNLLLMYGHNIRSGVLRYTQTYVAISVLLQFMLISVYIGTMGYGMAILGLFLYHVFLYAIISGLFPIIGIALYQPALRFVKYIVGREIIVVEPED